VLGFLRRRRHERAGHELYCIAVAAARQEWFYRALTVPDTLDGRFDLVGLHAWLLIRRLTALPSPGPQVAQAVFDAMFADMDINLREMGVSDLTVGRRVRAMWEAFHGRATAYEAALGDPAALAAALARNVWRDAAPPGAAERLAAHVRDQAAAVEALAPAALLSGQAGFAAPAPVAA
jgi:cytochrome b pre-mRNA-processing protein 3